MTYGINKKKASLFSLYIKFKIKIFIAINKYISRSAIKGIWNLKNNHDHAALKNNWIIKIEKIFL